MDRHLPGGPLVTSRRGFFWVGTERAKRPFGTVAHGPMYVQWEAPENPRQAAPVVLIHGGGGQGTDWLGTPDGRPGWATYLVQEGYVVYVVDRPGHGRSSFHPEILGPMSPPLTYEFCEWLFTVPPKAPPESAALSPTGATSHPHTQWPGDGGGGDPVIDQFMASGGPMMADTAAAHALEQARGVELLDLVGPAIVFSHSAGGPLGWLMADARPDLVRALVAIEPLGPPFLDNPAGGPSLPWGLTAAPLTFDPPAADPSELRLTALEGPEGVPPLRIQADPPRRLPNVSRVPIALVSAEVSPFASFHAATLSFLQQCGCAADSIRLADHGVRGNGHGMIFERNNREVLNVILDWLARGSGRQGS